MSSSYFNISHTSRKKCYEISIGRGQATSLQSAPGPRRRLAGRRWMRPRQGRPKARLNCGAKGSLAAPTRISFGFEVRPVGKHIK